MLYFDTSFLVPLLIPEETSMRIEGFFHHLPPEEMLAVSQWTRIEFASVLSRLVRMRQFDLHVARECAERFTRLLDESFNIIAPGEGTLGVAGISWCASITACGRETPFILRLQKTTVLRKYTR